MASISSALNTVPDPTSAASASKGSLSSSSTDALATESTFLQLLVAQIKNQDPTAPMDSTAFLGQLAQFSQLEQLVGIRQDIEKPAANTPTTPITSPTGN